MLFRPPCTAYTCVRVYCRTTATATAAAVIISTYATSGFESLSYHFEWTSGEVRLCVRCSMFANKYSVTRSRRRLQWIAYGTLRLHATCVWCERRHMVSAAVYTCVASFAGAIDERTNERESETSLSWKRGKCKYDVAGETVTSQRSASCLAVVKLMTTQNLFRYSVSDQMDCRGTHFACTTARPLHGSVSMSNISHVAESGATNFTITPAYTSQTALLLTRWMIDRDFVNAGERKLKS